MLNSGIDSRSSRRLRWTDSQKTKTSMSSKDILSIRSGSASHSRLGHSPRLICSVTGPKTFEQDKSWLRVGIAVRAGIDINLHRVALSKSARQGLPNWLLRMIIRTWLLTYVIDRTLSAQLGKPATMRGEPSFQLYSDLLSHGEGRKTIDDAWVSSLAVCPSSSRLDNELIMKEWTQVLGIVHDVFGSDSSDFPTARSVSSQFPDLVHVFQKQFHQLCDSSLASARAFEHIDGGRASKFMIANVHLYSRYARLIVHSFALQRASESRKADLPAAFAEVCSPVSRYPIMLTISIKFRLSVSLRNLNPTSKPSA
jgi:hypothetical protein